MHAIMLDIALWFGCSELPPQNTKPYLYKTIIGLTECVHYTVVIWGDLLGGVQRWKGAICWDGPMGSGQDAREWSQA